jgi:hypothetical protein
MGGSTISTSETKIEAMQLQSSAYGAIIPVVGGVNRIPGNLIWYGDFKAIPHTSTQSSGGKGGGVKTQNTTYEYTASVLMGICQGQVTSIPRIWKGKALISEAGFTTMAQASETYVVPVGGGSYTVTHAAAFGSNVSVTWPEQGYNDRVFLRTLAEGRDYSVSAGVYSFPAGGVADGITVTINYQYVASTATKTAMQQLGISLATGDMAQGVPAWLSSTHPTEALSYPGLAYVHAQNYSLGTGAAIENHSFEIQGAGAYRYGSTLPDCNPAEFAANLLVNGRYGARMPAAALDVQDWLTYCAAAGLLMSPVLSEQQRAGDFVEQLCKLTNSAPVWSFDRLRIVPYADVALTGNGVTYTPNTTPLYDLDDDHWLQDGSDDPLQWSLKIGRAHV